MRKTNDPMPKLSIIVPVYNAEKYVRAMIESIIAQTFTDWEAILVDDGSKDEGGRICEEYSHRDSRIRVIHKLNGGVSSARNKGLQYAIGDFITFVDADDTLNPSFLSNFSYDEGLDFEIQGFIVNHINAPENNTVVLPHDTKIAPLGEIYAESELLKLSRGPVCKLMKTSIIKENHILYPSGLSFGEDAIFVKQYLLHCSGNARSISAADYIYNNYGDPHSLTHRVHPAQAMYDVAKMDFDLYMSIIKKFGRMPEIVDSEFRRIRTLEFYQSIVICMREKNRTRLQKQEFLEMARSGLYLQVKAYGILPLSYRVIKFCMDFLPLNISTYLLSIMFK